jgi:uncharacterized protein YjbI with pentapeptide repeats
MANSEHLEILNQGVDAWNEWRKENTAFIPILDKANLSKFHLPNANLYGANLRAANLREANLSEADLRGADLREANLFKANLIRANLRGAHLIEACLIDAFMWEVDLFGANLNGANMRRVSLNDALLRQAHLNETDLREAHLYSADLREALMHGANLSGADLNQANLTDTVLIEATLKNSTLISAVLFRTYLSGSEISGANLEYTDLSRCDIGGVKCTHIFWKGKRLKFKEGEFEKYFKFIENTVEIILDLPFSEVSNLTGRLIQEAVDRKYGQGTLLFKGQTALSNETTRYEYMVFDPSIQLDELQTQLSQLQNHLEPVIEKAKANNEPKKIIGVKDEIDLPFAKGLVVRPKELVPLVTKGYLRLSPNVQAFLLKVTEVTNRILGIHPTEEKEELHDPD